MKTHPQTRQPKRIFSKKQSVRILLFLCLATFSCLPVAGQNIQNPQSAVDNLMRSSLRVDPASGAMQLEVPLGSYRGRGEASLPVTLNYSSKVWNIKHQSTSPCNGEPVTSYRAEYAKSSASGWTSSLGWLLPTEDLSLELYEGQHGKPAQQGNPTLFRIMRKFIRLPDGSRHEVRLDDIRHGLGDSQSGSYYSVDGSRLRYDTTTDILFMPNGSRILNYASGRIIGNPPTQYIDRNGNFLTFDSSSNTWTDTLGRNIAIPIPGAAPAAGDYVVTLPGGISYTMRWRNLADARTNPSDPLRFPGDAPSANCNLGGAQPGTLFSTLDANNKILKGSLFNPVVLWQISLPNNTNYTFTYNVYGEIDKIVYPTGGTEQLTYGVWEPLGGQLDDGTYSQANRGVNSHAVSDGVTPAQVWTYGGNTFEPGVDPATDVRVVTAPNGTVTRTWYYISRGTQIKYGFDDARTGMEREVRVYNSAGTMLRRTVNQLVMDGPQPGGYQTATRNARVVRSVDIILDTGGDALAATTEMAYDLDLNVISTKRYDYVAISQSTGQTGDYTGIPNGTLLRTEETDYLTGDQAYRDRNLLSLPIATRVRDGAGNVIAQSSISYDEAAFPLLSYGAVLGWADPGTSARGNPTTTSRWLNFNGSGFSTFPSGTYLLTHAQFDQCGNVRKTWDAGDPALLNPAQFEYSSSYHFAYPTLNTSPDPDGTGPLSPQTISAEYDFSTGLITAMTDANGHQTTFAYNDPLLRLKQVVRAADVGAVKNQTTYIYDDSARVITVTSDLNAFNDNLLKSVMIFDGLGRKTETRQYETGTNYITAKTEYDNMSRPHQVSNPYRPLASPPESPVWTITTFDALGRVLTVTTPDNAVVTTSYSGNAVTTTDQTGKSRKSAIDPIGQLKEVYEDPAGVNYQTSYSYDVTGNLVRVTQGSQQRYFLYDSLSRLLRVRNPEQGTYSGLNLADPLTGNSQWSFAHQYDNKGNLTQRTDARGVVSTFNYDALNRNTSIDYSDSTPDVYRQYDQAVNGKGRINQTWQAGTITSMTNIDEYDALGRPRVLRQRFETNGVWSSSYQTQRSYNLAGAVISQTYPSLHTVNYNYDAAGRLADKDAQNLAFTGNLGDGVTRTYATGISYSPFGGLTREQFGTTTPIYHKQHYNNRGQLYDMRASTVNDDSNWNRGAIVNYYSLSNFTFGGTGTDTNGNLYVQQHWIPNDDQISGYTAHQQNYDYDSLNRIRWVGEYLNASQNTGSQTFTYDRWGNRTVAGSGTGINNKQFSVDVNTNRLGVPSGQPGTMSYDNAGNLTTDTYTGAGDRVYDAENRMTKAWGGNNQWQEYTYDADGQRTRRKIDGVETWQIYGFDGELLAEYAANGAPSSPQKEYGYRNGQLLIVTEAGAPSGSSNVALNKPATQVSTYDVAVASRAVDGNTDGNYWGNSVTHTLSGAQEWWQVDLGSSYSLETIKIWNRTDCCGDRLSNFYVFVSDQPFTSYDLTTTLNQAGVSNYHTPGQGGTPTSIAVNRTGRYVRVQLVNPGLLSLAEVVVMGSPTPVLTNVALNKPATQVSTYDVAVASRAVDGNTDGNYWGNSVTHTLSGAQEWWQVDLGSSYSLQTVKLWNRTDCCGDRLSNFYVFVSDQPFTSYDLTTTLNQAGVSSYHTPGQGGTPTSIAVNRTGRYVRVQLVNPGLLSLAEVEVMGSTGTTSNIQWLVADHLGTPRMVFDKTGSLSAMKRHDYLPFGEELFAGVGGRTPQNGYTADTIRQKFTSKERDNETGLDFFEARYYASMLGRFTSADPLMASGRRYNPQTWNRYTYVLNNPLSLTDPDGLQDQPTLSELARRMREARKNEPVTTTTTPIATTLQLKPPPITPLEDRFTPNPNKSVPPMILADKTNLVGSGSAVGTVQLQNGQTINAGRIINSETGGLVTNCNGYTFANGNLIIGNDQVPALLSGEGYADVTDQARQNNDVAVYYSAQNTVVHSAIVSGTENGQATQVTGFRNEITRYGQAITSAPGVGPSGNFPPVPNPGRNDPNAASVKYFRQQKPATTVKPN